MAYNEKYGITPQAAGKKSTHNPILAFLEMTTKLNDEQLDEAVEEAKQDAVPLENLPELIQQLEERMKGAASKLDFEEAANLRDRIKQLRQKLVGKN